MTDAVGSYQPLKPGEFRLLRSFKNKLEFELKCYHLDEAPKYTALSYRCSEFKAECVITVGGEPLQVGQNLSDACRRAKASLLQDETYFWADAICISQSDNDERSQQVQMMRHIYEKAYKVYVWLGWPDGSVYSSLGVKHMRYLYKLVWEAHQVHGGDLPSKITAILGEDNWKRVYDTDPTSETYRAWQEITALCNVDWWHQSWVYQEASTPETKERAKTLFFYGLYCTTRHEIASACTVAMNLSQTTDLSTLIGNLGAAQSLMTFTMERRLDEMYFLSLLNRFRPSSSTDSRDKVYVPLGLARGVDDCGIVPDYERSAFDVFVDVGNSLSPS